MDRNLSMGLDGRFKLWSLSARRAWIEISIDDLEPSTTRVALRKESVDRNWLFLPSWSLCPVALRKESVDRNLWWGVRKAVGSLVALRKESVDRNKGTLINSNCNFTSLSARRAWIEIPGFCRMTAEK